ncbi:hypothetical protein ACFXHA_38905 [Nocardia sp. NPDC059240]|uniref:hypothetical protein n=1 Tax=Nocardia sp. NPDC059240 TaxID=3346786 RepID=UPI0036AB1C82
MTRKDVPGTVYLLHFDQPFRHARHYTGWTTDLDARLTEHRAGRGARLLEVLRDNGIGWELARTWAGTRGRERQLKREGGASRRCPKCGVRPRHEPTASSAEDMGAVIRQARRDIADRHAERDRARTQQVPPLPRWVSKMPADELERRLCEIEARRIDPPHRIERSR